MEVCVNHFELQICSKTISDSRMLFCSQNLKMIKRVDTVSGSSSRTSS